jgi:hypothetical protein
LNIKGGVIMKAICANNKIHNEFITTAHVVQTWKVDKEGDFIEEVSTDEVTHGPDKNNIWTCAICGAKAIVE